MTFRNLQPRKEKEVVKSGLELRGGLTPVLPPETARRAERVLTCPCSEWPQVLGETGGVGGGPGGYADLTERKPS